MSETFNPRSVKAMWKLGLLPVEALPGVATEALLAGYDSKAIVAVASSANEDSANIRKNFERCLSDMDPLEMAVPEALREYAKGVARSILSGELTPFRGASQIWAARVKAGIQGDHSLDGFVYAASEIPDRPNQREIFEDGIILEARKLIDKFDDDARPARSDVK